MARKKVQEGHLGDMAYKAEMDHEVQMARSDLFKVAKYAVELHDMLKSVSEAEGIEGWQQAKITKAADYLGSVYHSMDYEHNQMDVEYTTNESEQLDEGPLGDLAKLAAKTSLGKRAGEIATKVRQRVLNRRASTLANLAYTHAAAKAEINKLVAIANARAKKGALQIAVFKTLKTRNDALDAANKLGQMAERGILKRFYKGDLGNADVKIRSLIKQVVELEDAVDNNMARRAVKKAQLELLRTTDIAKEIIEQTQDAKNKYDATTSALLLGLGGAWWLIDAGIKKLKDTTDSEETETPVDEAEVEEGNEFAQRVRELKASGAKPGTKFKTSDGKEHTLESTRKSANASMLRIVEQAIRYQASNIGRADVSPKAIKLAETTHKDDLRRLALDFKKRVIAEGQFGEITHHDEDATQSEVLVKGMGVYRMEQLEQRIKDRLSNVAQLMDRGEPDQAARLLDANSGTYKSLIAMMKAYAEAHDDLAFGDHGGSGNDASFDGAASGMRAAYGESKKKKPDADGDGVPDWADKKPGEDDNAKKKEVSEDTDIPFNQCPSCGGEIVHVSEAAKKGGGPKDACYHKVKRRYKVWPSAYASGALVQCRKKGAANWGNSGQR